MWPHKKLNNLFFIFFILFSVQAYALETKWEVGILFLGQNEDESFQKDVDINLKELSRIAPSQNLKIGIYRESIDGHYTYSISTEKNLIQKKTSKDYSAFLSTFYSKSQSKKALIIYSHGKGADGLKDYSSLELKNTLSELPHLDLVWFDACFMANLEFLYELRSFSDFTLASEEAEFSSGLPFQVLKYLPKLATAQDAGLFLGQQFIESYSFLKKGKQRNYVSVSSATISMVENRKLNSFANRLKSVSASIKKLPAEVKAKFLKKLKASASMDDKTFVDLGMLLIELRRATASTDKELTTLIRLLNIESVKKLRSNPRFHIDVDAKADAIVFGYNNWMDGTKKDFEANDLFSKLIKNDGFLKGRDNEEWPYKNVSGDSLVLTPFAPGVNSFDYYFINQKGERISRSESVTRTHDFVESLADTEETPLIYTAYTQQVGTKAERYTGLNISLPESVPSMDYAEMEFNKLAQWLSL